MLTAAEAREMLASSDMLCSAAQIEQAVAQMAIDITKTLEREYPLVLCAMTGAAVFAGHLLPRLRFPLDFDYLHFTRYRGEIHGGEVQCKAFPETVIAGRVVLIVDDILDQGDTMVAIRERVERAGARRFYCAALVDKDVGRDKLIQADFVGLRLPNRYLFGFGMDARGAWRNLPDIYALNSPRS